MVLHKKYLEHFSQLNLSVFVQPHEKTELNNMTGEEIAQNVTLGVENSGEAGAILAKGLHHVSKTTTETVVCDKDSHSHSITETFASLDWKVVLCVGLVAAISVGATLWIGSKYWGNEDEGNKKKSSDK